MAIPEEGMPRRPWPIERWSLVFEVDGLPIQFIGERWRDSDAHACPHPLMPDPRCPGESVVIRLISLVTGTSSLPISPEAVAKWAQVATWTDAPLLRFRR